MKKTYLVLVIIIAYCGYGYAQQLGKATYKEYEKAYTTYPFDDPDPIAAHEKLYPYYRFDGFSNKGERKKWKVVTLENDYLRITLLPEIGGKIWSAYDKVNKKDFLYNNEVVKFRDIALRGPWVSGGIEANYGVIGHTPNSATPVDYLVRSKKDGSVSCYISVLDLLTRTRWILEVNLQPDSAYFTTKSYWFNQTEVEQPYYTWMNSGIPAGDDLKFLYPGSDYLGHDGIAHPWPLNENRDLSYYRSNAFGGSKSFHVFGKHSSYFGGIWEDQDYGMIRYSTREDKLGKKIFLWAQSEEGEIWEDLLTDNSGQYVEMQSGRLFNQNTVQSSKTPFKQIGFKPYAVEQWEEYWYPFGGLDGFSFADRLGAYKFLKTEKVFQIVISPIEPIVGELQLLDKDFQAIAKEGLNVEPLKPHLLTLNIDRKSSPEYIKINDHLIRLSKEEQQPLERPRSTPDSFNQKDFYGQYLMGRDQYRFRAYSEAYAHLKNSIKLNANFLPSLVEMAKVKLFQMQYDSAFYYAKRALSIDTYNAQANYYYGVSAKALNKIPDAKDGFEVAALSPEMRAAAYHQLSRLNFIEKDYSQAELYAEKALREQPQNMDALKLMYVLGRIQKDESQANKVKKQISALNPLSHFLRFEEYLKSGSKEDEQAFTGLIRNEMPFETYLELALWYVNLDRKQEAISILKMAPSNIIGLYWLSDLSSEGSQAEMYFKKAEEQSIEFAFPYREETYQLLNRLSEKVNSNSWKIDYLTALLVNFRGSKTEAKQLLEKHSSAPSALYKVIYARLLDVHELDQKIALLEDAIKLDPEQWRYRLILSELYALDNRPEKGVKVLEKTYKDNPDNYIVGMTYVKLLMRVENYIQSESVLSDILILPFEGAKDGRKLYRKTKLMLAYQAYKKDNYKVALQKIDQSEEWPVNLGVGKPYDDLIDNRLENEMRIIIYSKMGNRQMKNKYLKLVDNKPVDEQNIHSRIEVITETSDVYLF